MEDGSAMVSAYLQGQWSRIGNGTGLGGATPTPFQSQLYKSISHRRPILRAGRGRLERLVSAFNEVLDFLGQFGHFSIIGSGLK